MSGTTLTRARMLEALDRWIRAWGDHDLDGVMELFHEDVVFENWTGARVEGRENLRRAWEPWFAGRDFRFLTEDLFVDEADQKALYRWTLEWISRLPGHEGRLERRRGVDVIRFRDGLIAAKLTYLKTCVEVGGEALRPAGYRPK